MSDAQVNECENASSIQSLQQLKENGMKLSAEQEEELKLRNKYPNPQRPGGSAFIQKMLHKGSKKYFDSGDYNMAKSKIKALNGANTNKTVVTASAAANEANMASSEMSPVDLSSPKVQICLDNSGSTLSPCSEPSNHSFSLKTPVVNNEDSIQLSNYSKTMSPMASSVSSSNLNEGSANPNHLMPSSISTQSISLVGSPSIHHFNSPTCILDSEEIGQGIPTPECLPQLRKHTIVQSKLASSRLSTS